MSLLWWIVLFCLLGGVLSAVAAAVFLVVPRVWQERAMPHMVSFATGALLGAAFLAILPHALESEFVTDAHHVTQVVLLGLLGFFVLEKAVLWRHCHSSRCEAHGDLLDESSNGAGLLVLVGDAFHNFVDGVLIAAAFLTDISLGIVTSLAVAIHEIPQELGDFAVLLHSGYSRAKAFLFNILVSLTTIVGGVIAYFSLHMAQSWVPYVLAIAAASIIYIAVADLIPGLHRRVSPGETLRQVVLLAAGVLIITFAHGAMH